MELFYIVMGGIQFGKYHGFIQFKHGVKIIKYDFIKI